MRNLLAPKDNNTKALIIFHLCVNFTHIFTQETKTAALIEATANNHIEIVQLLLEDGVDDKVRLSIICQFPGFLFGFPVFSFYNW